jgi:Concanavalin A-like lectin/glucanases superfamily
MARFRIPLGIVLATAAVLLFASAATAQTVVASWHMEDPATMTDSAGSHDGTTTAITSVDGVSGAGYAWDGTTSRVVVPHAADLNPGDADFSFTVHVRFTQAPSAAQGTYDLMRKGNSTTAGGYWKVEVVRADDGAARIGCYFGGSANASAKRVAGDDLADDAWHTITCTRTATKIFTIIDGVAASKTVTVGTIANSDPVLLGSKTATGKVGDPYKGWMDEVSISAG